MFDSLRRFRKIVGRLRLYVIQNFYSDGRLARITGPQGARVVPILKDKTAGEYNVVVADTPTSPNMKEANWAVIQLMLPIFKDQLVQQPDLLVNILEYSPLPQKLIDNMRQLLAQKGPEMQQQKQLGIAQATANINKAQAQAELALSQAGKQEDTALFDLATSIAELAKTQREQGLTDAKEVKERMQAAHLRVKTALDALTPVEHVPSDEHAHHIAIRDHAHELERIDRENEHKKEIERIKAEEAAKQRAHDREMGMAQMSHEKYMGDQGHYADMKMAQADREHESEEGKQDRKAQLQVAKERPRPSAP